METTLLEKLIIKACCLDQDFMATLSTSFSKDYFDNKTASKVYDYLVKHFQEYGKIAPKSVVISEYDVGGSNDVGEFYQDIESIDFNYVNNHDFLFDKTNAYLKEKAVKEAFLKGVDIINRKEDFALLRPLMDDALAKDLRIDLGTDYFGSLQERLTRLMGPGAVRIPTGFPTLDEYITGGIPPYTLSVIVARIHGFKCLSGDTKITINNNGFVKCLPIKEFFINTYNREYNGGESMIKNNRMDMFVKKYGDEEGQKRYNQWVSRQKDSHKGQSGFTLENCIKKYGKINGTVKYNEYITKLKASNKNINKLEYYTNKYGDEEGSLLYKEKNKKISDPGRGTLGYFQNRYGIDDGIIYYEKYIQRQKMSNSLDGYVVKYGEIDGRIKWAERCKRSAYCRTLNGFISKYGETEGLKRWQQKQERWMKSYKKSNFSKISQKLFWLLYEKIKGCYDEIYFAELNGGCEDMTGKNNEYVLKLEKSYCRLDFFIKDLGKCIEFDGDYWHGEKRGNQEKDGKRTKQIEDMGIHVLHVSERDFNKTPEMVVEQCLRFINE